MGFGRRDPEIGDSVAIVGCGFMGLIMMQVFRARGVGDIIAVDRRDSVLQLAEVLGATHLVNTSEVTDAVSAIKDITGGRGVDIGVEAGGSQATLDLTSQIVRMEGKLEVFGFHQGSPRSVDWGWWNWMAFEIVNGHTRNPAVYVEGVRLGIGMLEQGQLDMKSLVTHRYSLAEINDGFRAAASKPEGFVKGVIAFEN
jgi:threonine dehydrogenase-like Zn-dependent dehydrogenase